MGTTVGLRRCERCSPPVCLTGAKVQLKLLVKETPSKKSRAARLEYYLDGVDTESPYTITVVDVKPTTEDMAKVVDAFRHLGIANHEFAAAVYERLHSGEYPLSVLVYSDHDKANTVVFVERLNYTVWHVLQGLMRKGMFKRLFEEKALYGAGNPSAPGSGRSRGRL